MADDASYNTFLSKANADLSSSDSQSTSQARSKFDPSSQPNDSLPSSLKGVVSNDSITYTSDTDSVFEPFFASYSGSGAPSALDFRNCLQHATQHDREVEALSVEDFDPRQEYKRVIEAVKGAGKGEVRVFRVEVGKSRVEYYVVTVADDGRKLVGVMTKAIES